jgi:hypothetical protein
MKRMWVPLDESEREQWTFIPLTAVGPLRFGMTYDEAVAALGGIRPAPYLSRRRAQFDEPTVTTYYNESKTLACVAIDAMHGPQVTMDGLRLTGRVPSELRQQFEDYVAAHGIGLFISSQADPGSEELGLVLRAQRAEDVLLTRPVFVAGEWAYRCGDASEGPIPKEEWLQR